MKIRTAVANAWKLYTGHFGEMMKFLLLEVVLRLIVAAPLLLLASKATQLLALLSVPLFILIVLPARRCAAEAMRNAIRGEGSIFSLKLCVTQGYWQKVAAGLKQAALLILWALPFLAATGWALNIFFAPAVQGQTDVFSLMIAISNLGGGDIVNGVILLMLMYVGLFLPFLAGCAFHSGSRHERAAGVRLVRGHRGGVIGVWLVSLVTVVPFAAITAAVSMGYIRALVKAVSNMATGLVIPPLDQNVYIILGAFVVLMLPLLPLKSLMTAYYVQGLEEAAK